MIEEEVNTLKKMFHAHTKEEFHPHITSEKSMYLLVQYFTLTSLFITRTKYTNNLFYLN